MKPIDRLRLSEGIQSIGAHGVVGLALLAFAASYAASTLLPSWQALVQQRAAAATTGESAARKRAADATPAASLAQFYGSFPMDDVAGPLARVYAAAAEQRLALPRGDYQASVEPRTGLLRYAVVLPVRGSYAQIREFVGTALRAVPTMALDQVSFERPKVSEGDVSARLRFVLYLRRSPA